MKKLLVNGQWQGGADICTLHGAKEIENFYLDGINYDEAAVSTDESSLRVENGIVGYQILKTQMAQVLRQLTADQPDQLFTIGGGCDADFPSIAYMNQKYGGKLKILYFDAHGDINSPEESESRLFYGMPLRCLMPDFSHSLLPAANCGIRPEQIIHIGARDLDNSESRFMEENNIHRITVEQAARIDFSQLPIAADEKVYIHLDLDALEPQDFPHVPLPVPGGIPARTLTQLLEEIKNSRCIVGVGIFEYKPCGQGNPLLKHLIQYGLDF